MASKKELEKRIIELEQRLLTLENMHARIFPVGSWENYNPFKTPLTAYKNRYQGNEANYCGRALTAEEIKTRPKHPQPDQIDYKRITNIPPSAVDTDRVSRVTLKELARLVIDGEPIRREEKVIYKRLFEHTMDGTTRITFPDKKE